VHLILNETQRDAWSRERAAALIHGIRLSSALGAVAFASFVLVDLMWIEGSLVPLLVTRACVLLGFGLLALAAGRVAHVQRAEMLAVAACLWTGGGVIAVTVLAGGAATFYFDALLVTFIGFTAVTPLTGRQAGASFAALAVAYAAVMIGFNQMGPVSQFVTQNAILWAGVLVATAAAWRLERGAAAEFLGRRKVEEALEDTREMERLRSRLFANVSHELRTPLTLVLAPVEIALRDDGLSVPTRRHLEMVQRNASRLLRLVNHLLDLARIDAGHMQLHLERIDLLALVNIHVDAFRAIAQRGGVTMTVVGDGPIWCGLDIDKTEMILANLLSNAVKFTPSGSVTVRMHSDDQTVGFDVVDTGKGIDETFHEAVFQRFRQVEDGDDRGRGGTGIGLAFTRELALLMEGTVRLDSSLGQGTTVSIRLARRSVDALPDGRATAVDADAWLTGATPDGALVRQTPPHRMSCWWRTTQTFWASWRACCRHPSQWSKRSTARRRCASPTRRCPTSSLPT
jgi:signal transduction histidine kinase